MQTLVLHVMERPNISTLPSVDTSVVVSPIVTPSIRLRRAITVRYNPPGILRRQFCNRRRCFSRGLICKPWVSRPILREARHLLMHSTRNDIYVYNIYSFNFTLCISLDLTPFHPTNHYRDGNKQLFSENFLPTTILTTSFCSHLILLLFELIYRSRLIPNHQSRL